MDESHPCHGKMTNNTISLWLVKWPVTMALVLLVTPVSSIYDFPYCIGKKCDNHPSSILPKKGSPIFAQISWIKMKQYQQKQQLVPKKWTNKPFSHSETVCQLAPFHQHDQYGCTVMGYKESSYRASRGFSRVLSIPLLLLYRFRLLPWADIRIHRRLSILWMKKCTRKLPRCESNNHKESPPLSSSPPRTPRSLKIWGETPAFRNSAKLQKEYLGIVFEKATKKRKA